MVIHIFAVLGFFLAFTGAKPRKPKADENAVADGDGESMDQADDAANKEPPVDLGPVATALFSSNVSDGGLITSDGMLARVLSWLLASANWPDSKVCAKAVKLCVKILDFVS